MEFVRSRVKIDEVLEIALQCTEMSWQRKMHINISPASVEIHEIPAHRRPALRPKFIHAKLYKNIKIWYMPKCTIGKATAGK